jgi:hypothetical protein
MASRPPIPQRYSSLIPESSRKDMKILSKRTASTMTAMSQLSTTSSTNKFIDAQIESISADLCRGTSKEGVKGLHSLRATVAAYELASG